MDYEDRVWCYRLVKYLKSNIELSDASNVYVYIVMKFIHAIHLLICFSYAFHINQRYVVLATKIIINHMVHIRDLWYQILTFWTSSNKIYILKVENVELMLLHMWIYLYLRY